jgi:hypothetical protein
MRYGNSGELPYSFLSLTAGYKSVFIEQILVSPCLQANAEVALKFLLATACFVVALLIYIYTVKPVAVVDHEIIFLLNYPRLY